ncbi:MAG: hypothetical protein R8L53_05460 [Mariprofundales bacterium]
MRNALIASMLACALVLTACGGGSSATNSTPATTTIAAPAITTTINGVAIAGAVTGTVNVNDGTGTNIANAAINNGSFSVTVPNSALAANLQFVVTGTYRDEVSGQTVTLSAQNPLALYTAVNHFTAGVIGNAPITPDTSIISTLVQQGKSLAQAKNSFQTAFGYLPDLNATPFDPYATAAPTATSKTQADKNAAFFVGMFSQLANDLGLNVTDLAELPAKLAADLSDGALDGMQAGNPIIFASSGINIANLHQNKPLDVRLQQAVSGFAGNAANISNVTAPNMQLPPMVHDNYTGSTKTITTAGGQQWNVTLDTIAQSPFAQGFNVARTTHRISVINSTTNQPVDLYAAGITAMQHPWMFMFSGHAHGTEHGQCDISQAAQGILQGDVYYRMASKTASGMPMGLWQYEVRFYEPAPVDAYTSVMFFPNVRMGMGADILKGAAKNAGDTWTNMTGLTNPRTYNVWLHAITANVTSGYDVSVFIATQNMMDMTNMAGMMGVGMSAMSFPPLNAGLMLNGAKNAMSMRPMHMVKTVLAEISADAGLTWQLLSAQGGGIYKTTSLLGLTSGTVANLQVRLTVDGNPMLDAGGNNPALSFTTP